MATEKRLIYLDDIKDALRSVSEDTTCPVHIAAEIDQIVELAPTVDAVEVVRCKDCFANGCCSVQIDLDMGDEGYCPKGRKET